MKNQITNYKKEKYINFCEEIPDLPIFFQNWWLDAVSENWDVSLVEKGNKIIAVQPFAIEKKWKFTFIKNPILTPYLGPWIVYQLNQNQIKKIAYDKKIITKLIQNFPDFDKFTSSFHYSFTNWLPYYWQSFSQTTRYTYLIEKNMNIQEVFENFQDKARWEIRKAQKNLIIDEKITIKELYKLVVETYKRQNLSPPYKFNLLKNLDAELYKRKKNKIIAIKDKNNNIHSIGYFVHDKQTLHYLISGSDPQYRGSGSISLVIFEGIKYALGNGFDFNFEGSMIEPIEKSFRSFGGKLIPYFHISKINSRILRIKNM